MSTATAARVSYLVTKTFVGGFLKGITIVEETSVRYEVGLTYLKPIGGNPYRIDAVTEVAR